MADDSCDTCIMEVSSLGLKAGRVAGLAFAVGIFTNFSPDHIGPGEHADLAEYLHWKAALFPHCAAGVFNNDDAWVGENSAGRTLPRRDLRHRPPGRSARGRRHHADPHRRAAGGSLHGGRRAVHRGQPGAFSVYNAGGAGWRQRGCSAPGSRLSAGGLAEAVVRGRSSLPQSARRSRC